MDRIYMSYIAFISKHFHFKEVCFSQCIEMQYLFVFLSFVLKITDVRGCVKWACQAIYIFFDFFLGKV